MCACRLSYYSLLPRLTHLSFGVLGACSLRSRWFREAMASHHFTPCVPIFTFHLQTTTRFSFVRPEFRLE